MPGNFITVIPTVLVLALTASLGGVANLLSSASFIRNTLGGTTNLGAFLPTVVFLITYKVSFTANAS